MSIERKLFHENPTTTVDHYFVMENILDWSVNTGLGIIGTNASNILLKDIKPFYLHKEKTNTTMKHIKASRFFEPIVAVKKDS